MNNFSVIGRLTADPELKSTTSGRQVVSFTIANDKKFSGDADKTNFFNVVAWNKTAEFICKHFSKGSMIALSGRMETRSYTDKNDNKRTVFELVAEDVSFCGDKKESKKADVVFQDIPDDEEDLPF